MPKRLSTDLRDRIVLAIFNPILRRLLSREYQTNVALALVLAGRYTALRRAEAAEAKLKRAIDDSRAT